VFLGMIGSARKARMISEHFIKNKIATAGQMARVACPVGLKIRSQSVMEIAVDIMAQYIDKRAGLRSDPQTGAARQTKLV
jgi:xanthine/CO dehydrogenase XdhC/CoxF family maturation factor